MKFFLPVVALTVSFSGTAFGATLPGQLPEFPADNAATFAESPDGPGSDVQSTIETAGTPTTVETADTSAVTESLDISVTAEIPVSHSENSGEMPAANQIPGAIEEDGEGKVQSPDATLFTAETLGNTPELSPGAKAPAVAQPIKTVFVQLKDLPPDLRPTLSWLEKLPQYAGLPGAPGRLMRGPSTEADIPVVLGKPWLARPLEGPAKSAPGCCPMKISYGLRAVRQEEGPALPWPYERTEVIRDGDVERETTSRKNLGNFYALIDPLSGTYAVYEKSAEMPWRDGITQTEIDALCEKAFRAPARREVSGERPPEFDLPSGQMLWEDGRAFLDHQPGDVKRACPGGGCDTFAATYGVFFQLEKEVFAVLDREGNRVPEKSSELLTCRVQSQICCFDSEAPWPLHSFYPGESGKGYDNPDPDFTPSAEEIEQLGSINYAYSLLGSKGIDLSQLQADDVSLPDDIGDKDSWLKRTAPVMQPPKAPIPTLDQAILRKFEYQEKEAPGS